MARVHRHHAQPRASGTVGAAHHKRTGAKRKPSYKVVLEEVTGKKKLRTLLSFRAEAPQGYTFIPAGDPQLTNRCKKIAKDEQLTVFIVSTSKHPHEKLSREVHRIGYHFPSTVVDQACMTLGVDLTASGRVLESNFAFIDDHAKRQRQPGPGLNKKKSKGKRRNGSPGFDMNLSQAIIDTQAREAIKDLFPKIPADDLHTIIGRAFQKGKGLVGTVGELSLVRRAQLAVTAHIRHEYTDYDRILKITNNWAYARKEVQQACLDLLVQWRGDDDNDGELEDILREVIVISDDEDEDEMQQDVTSLRLPRDRSESVEIIPADAVYTHSVNYATANPADHGRSPSRDANSADAVEYLGDAPLIQDRPAQYTQHRLDQMGAHRHSIWEEAVNRQRRPPNDAFPRDTGPLLSTSQRFDQGHYQLPRQELPETRQQPYMTERAEGSPTVTHPYSRLIALPATEDRFNSTKQVSAPSQAERSNIGKPRLSRIREEPARFYYTDAPEGHLNNPSVYENRPSLIEARPENASFVKQSATGYDNGDVRHATPFDVSLRRQPEMILPSIESGPSHAKDQHSPFVDSFQKLHAFEQAYRDGREPLQRRDPSLIYVADDEHQPNLKRRRINDQQSLNQERPSRVLVPLNYRDGHSDMHPRPAAAAYSEDMPPDVLDKRILQLPPRENRRYGNAEGHTQTPSLHVPSENRLAHPREQSKVRYLNPEVPGQPQSPRSFGAFRPVHDLESPISSNVSAPFPREIVDQHASSHHAFGTAKWGGRVYPDCHVYRNPQRQFEEVQGQVQSGLQDLVINPDLLGDYDVSMKVDGRLKRGLYTSLQAPRGSVREAGSDVRRYHPVYETASALGSLEQRPFNQADVEHNDYGIGNYAHDAPQQIEYDRDGILRQPLSQSLSRRAEWSQAKPGEVQPSYGRVDNGLLRDQSNTRHLGYENIRSAARVHHDLGYNGRVPGELVILE